ncbi:hypothetical protein Hanom_Chr08g00745261 [Helianthus anomalus]
MDLLKPEITAGIYVKTTTDWDTEFSQRGFSVLTIFKHSGITCILNSRYIQSIVVILLFLVCFDCIKTDFNVPIPSIISYRRVLEFTKIECCSVHLVFLSKIEPEIGSIIRKKNQSMAPLSSDHHQRSYQSSVCLLLI